MNEIFSDVDGRWLMDGNKYLLSIQKPRKETKTTNENKQFKNTGTLDYWIINQDFDPN